MCVGGGGNLFKPGLFGSAMKIDVLRSSGMSPLSYISFIISYQFRNHLRLFESLLQSHILWMLFFRFLFYSFIVKVFAELV